MVIENNFMQKISFERINELMELILKNRFNSIDKTININQKVYNIILKNNKLILKCNDGRELNISLIEQILKEFDEEIDCLSNWRIDYIFKEYLLTICSLPRFNKDVDSIIERESFKYIVYGLEEHDYIDFLSNIGMYSYNNFLFSVNDEELELFDGENRITLTNNNHEIKYFNNEEIPSLFELRNFNNSEEMNKIKTIINDNKNKTNKFVNEFMENVMKKLDLYKTVLTYYIKNKDVFDKMYKLYNSMVNDLDNNLFSENELAYIISILSDEIQFNTNNFLKKLKI